MIKIDFRHHQQFLQCRNRDSGDTVHGRILCFKFRFLDSGQIVSNQNMLLVTDQNSGTHNQKEKFSLI